MSQNILANVGEPVPLYAVQALVDDPPAHFSDKQKRRLASFADRYEQAIRKAQRDRYAAAMGVVKETRDAITGSIEDHSQHVKKIHDAVAHGRMEPDDARKDLTATFREIKALRDRLEGLTRSERAAWDVTCLDADEYQVSRLERFPSLAQHLPRISQAWLDGEDEHDPLGND